MRRPFSAVLLCLLSACVEAVPTKAPARAVAVVSAPDRLIELLAYLPRGADECVLSRPGKLSRERRAQFVRISHSDPLAWVAQFDVAAYVAVRRSSRSGVSPRVMLLWLDHPPERVRGLLDLHSGLQLSWEGGERSCTPDRCPHGASFVAPQVVRIEYGRWPELRAEGVEGRCRKLAAQVPDALELTVARSRRIALSGVPGGLGGAALQSRTRVVPTRTGVRVSRMDLMPSIEAAARAVAEAELSALTGTQGDSLRSRYHHRQVDSALYTNYEVYWEDLAFAQQDEQRARSAESYAEALSKLRPAEGIDLGDRETLTAQVDYRLKLLENAGSSQSELAAELSTLLERALARYSDDSQFAFNLCELWLHRLDRAPDAHALATRFLGKHQGFRLLRREAAARVSAAALAAALREDGLVAPEGPQAELVAKRIIEALGAGGAYVDVEQSTLRGR